MIHISLWRVLLLLLFFSSLPSITLMIYLVCCLCQTVVLFCLYLKGVDFVNDLSVCPAGASVPRLCQHSAWGTGFRVWWGARGCGGTGGWRQGVFGVMWQRARSSASPAQQDAGLQTCESLSMPVQTTAKKRGLAVIRIDCLVLCLPIYIMDLSNSMMCFCQVLPH